MNKNTQIECNSKNPEFKKLLSSIDILTHENNKQRFSDNCNHFIVDSNLDQNDWQKNFVGEYSSEIIEILSRSLKLWQQIQENDLPFSYVKQQLDQKTFEEELEKIQFKINRIRLTG